MKVDNQTIQQVLSALRFMEQCGAILITIQDQRDLPDVIADAINSLPQSNSAK